MNRYGGAAMASADSGYDAVLTKNPVHPKCDASYPSVMHVGP